MAQKLLTGTVKTIIEVDYHDVDKAVNEFFKLKGIEGKCECVPDNEWSNDSSHSFNIAPELPSKDDEERIRSCHLSWRIGAILDWMCAEGHIDAGEYIIDICW